MGVHTPTRDAALHWTRIVSPTLSMEGREAAKWTMQDLASAIDTGDHDGVTKAAREILVDGLNVGTTEFAAYAMAYLAFLIIDSPPATTR